MKRRIGFGRFGLVLALLFAALHLSSGPSEWFLALDNHWVSNAAADDGSFYPAPNAQGVGQMTACMSGSGDRVTIVGFAPDSDSALAMVDCGGNSGWYCHGGCIVGLGWDSSKWGDRGRFRYGNACFFPGQFYTECVMYPINAQYLLPKNQTGDLGGPRRCGLSRDGDNPNLEGPIGEHPDNRTNLNSSVDLKSGNVYHSQQVGPLTFSYNSLDTSNGALGIGWTHDFEISIIPNSDGSLFLRYFDGNRIWFIPSVGNTYFADAKSRDT